MKISDFQLESVEEGNGPLTKTWLATVIVETGLWFWKRKELKWIARHDAGYWFWVDSGEFCPGHDVEKLERAYRVLEEDYR
jgi:hypothetical protein